MKKKHLARSRIGLLNANWFGKTANRKAVFERFLLQFTLECLAFNQVLFIKPKILDFAQKSVFTGQSAS